MQSKNKLNKKRGMTYVELIVVLSIFSVMASVILFNYSGFQGKIDIKNLASDIALKAVEAQKASIGGKLPPAAQQVQINSLWNPATLWKPSYGIYIDRIADNKSFIYFTDINSDGLFSDTACAGNSECLEKISITKGNVISYIQVFYTGGTLPPDPLSNLTISFVRPSSQMVIKSTTAFAAPVSYIQVTILSPKGSYAQIKLYPSGRIQVN